MAKAKSKSEFKHFIVIAIVILIVSICGFYITISTNESTTHTESGSSANKTLTPTPINKKLTQNEKPSAPITWRTYTNTQGGYSFQYPSDLNIVTKDSYSFLTRKTVKSITLSRPYTTENYTNWYELT